MTIDLSQFRSMFFEEARDYVAAFEQAVLILEREPSNTAAVHEMFRAAHSLKGCSATLGVNDVASFTHVLENLLDHMREGHVAASSELIELLLAASDTLAELLDTARKGRPAPAAAAELAERLAAPLADQAPAADRSPESRRLAICITPKPALLVDGLDPLPLLRELDELVELVSIEAITNGIPLLADLEPERCYVAWRVVVEDDPDRELEKEIREIFEFVEDACTLTISSAHEAELVASDEDAAAALIQRTAGFDRGAADTATLRVATDRVDDIINLVGELVIAQAGLNQAAGAFEDESLTESINHMGRTLHELQQCALSVRTLPLATVFCRFPRLVRDLATELEKDVRLEVVGAETELDKSVIEGLAGPLTHILRNAVDHGIESRSQRKTSGKPAQAVLRLAAYQEHGSVVIEVQDDGAGLNRERLIAKARSAGLVEADEVLNDERVLALVFEPGLSTADAVSDVSGRGVGMDAARDAIEALNGTLHVRSSTEAGTTIRITLPLTLAILDGFAVRTAEQSYIVPLMSVLEVVQPETGTLQRVLGKGELISIRGEPLPLVRLRDVLGLPAAYDEQAGLIVVVETLGERYGLLVDDVDGQATVVIKSLDESVRKNPAILGGTLRGDGSIAFILDLAGLVRLHRTVRRSCAVAGQGT